MVDSLCDRFSRAEGSLIRKGVGGSIMSASSVGWERMRGVPVRVPRVMSCLTAAGPSWEGVGEGREGT